jgi:predicted CxxxxCH...CXXCH cytochrome family protein
MARKSTVLFILMLPMVVLLGAVLFAGCGQQNAQENPATFDPQTGHPTGWAAAESHGATAKASAAGFSSCQECHGSAFSGGVSSTSCFICHGVNAPHPAAPWRGGAQTHGTTNAGNAAVCSTCHANGANSTRKPNPPAPAGTAPGCFNNTLCHGPAAGHPAGWNDPGQHGVSAEQDFTVCQSCHGANYQGGSASTTCYQCHNGPGLDHPAANWVIANHKTAALTGNTGCKTCHGADFLGGGSHVACNSCHMQNETKVHMTSWYPDVILNHRAYAKANGTALCSNASCHGANLTGVAQSGPSCSSCHTWPFTAATCGSCHGIPPAGSAAPNTAGAHAAHAALAASITCNTCHSGAGTGTIKHQDGIVDVSIEAVYNGKSGTAAFSGTAKTCSNVSCHGGPRTQTATQANQNPKQSTVSTTPSWLTGALDVNTQCTACHVLGSAAGNPENNSYYSGRHYLHVYQRSRACTACHDTAKLTAGHFTGLATAAFETSASATLLSAINYNSSTKSCTPSCHGSKTW